MEGLGAVQQTKATGRTCRCNAVCVRKVNAASRQPIHVGRDCLWVTTKKSRPVVHVIDGNEQNIRLVAPTV